MRSQNCCPPAMTATKTAPIAEAAPADFARLGCGTPGRIWRAPWRKRPYQNPPGRGTPPLGGLLTPLQAFWGLSDPLTNLV